METDAYPRELLADEEPKYLRRQKPLEIKRRKFGRKAWKTYLRVTVWAATGLAGAWCTYLVGNYLYSAHAMELIHPNQIEISQVHYVQRSRVLEIFAADRGHSVLRIPIDDRRRQIEALPWVEHATVRRALPNRIEIEIAERTPVAFLRQGAGVGLIDAHGVILPQPTQADFDFPVITGIMADMTPGEREERMQLFMAFSRDAEQARPGAISQVNEVDLSSADDLRATISGLSAGNAPGSLPAQNAAAPVLVHFGDSGFGEKYQTLVEDFAQWHAKAGRVESVDLRFSGEAVVNADSASALASALQPRHVQKQAARAAFAMRTPERK